MKYLLMLCLAFGAYKYYTDYSVPNYTPEAGDEVIKIYGTNSCKYTRETLAFLDSKGMKYQYRDVNEQESFQEMLSKLESKGMSTSRLEIPTLDIGGKLFIDPSERVITKEYASLNQ